MAEQFNESTVEEAALSWFEELGYAVEHGPVIAPGEPKAERASFGDVVLIARLREAIDRLNPDIPAEAREEAFRKVLRLDSPSLVGNNRAFHAMLRDGAEVEYRSTAGTIRGDRVRLVDFDQPAANDWLVVNQFAVIEGQNHRRPDIVVFVNGLSNQAPVGRGTYYVIQAKPDKKPDKSAIAHAGDEIGHKSDKSAIGPASEGRRREMSIIACIDRGVCQGGY